MKRVLLIALLVVGLVPCTSAGDNSRYVCVTPAPLESSIPASVASLDTFEVGSEFGSSRASFYFNNRSKKPVVRVFMVIELTDSQGNYLFSTMAHAYPRRILHQPPFFTTFDRTQLDDPIRPHEETLVLASSPWFSRNCPAKARVTFVRIEYKDGSEYAYSETGWRREASIIDAGYTELEGAPFVLPLEVMTTVRVDREGHPTVVEVGDQLEEFKQWLQTRVERWAFHPAYAKGVPVTSELRIFFRFHRESTIEYPLPSEFPDEPLYQVVDVAPPEPGKRLSFVLVGRSLVALESRPDE